jgi:uroporphyrin-3 C-methyltransferase
MDRRTARFLMLALPALVVLAALGWWMLRPAPAVVEDPFSNTALDARLLTVEQSIATLVRGQSRNEQRLADLEARSRVQREELLGWGQRIPLLEESVQQLADAPEVEVGTRLRLDEVDLLLGFAESRIALAGDVDGARRALAMADGLLAALTAPQFVNLRQTLAQEQAALAALPPDPRRAAQAAIDALERELPTLDAVPVPADPEPAATPLSRLLDALVHVRPRGVQDLLAPADRQRGEAGLHLELALARIAIERRDDAALHAAAARAAIWLRRLHAPGPALDAALARLATLGDARLAVAAPELGSTLAQLRAQRRGGGA